MPTKTLSLPGIRILGQAVAGVYSLTCPVFRCSGTQNGGFLCAPLQIPQDFDVSYPSSVYVWWGFPLVTTQAGTVVLNLNWTAAQPNVALAGSLDTQLPFVAIGSPAQTPARTLFDNAQGHTFNASTFLPDQILNLSARRWGTDASDTYPGDVDLYGSLELIYHQRCQKLCC